MFCLISYSRHFKIHKIIEIAGNERARVGGERKMHRIPTAIKLIKLIIRELFWKGY